MFQADVDTTDESAIDMLFGAKTPGADDILGGKKEKKDPKAADESVDDLDPDPNEDPVNPNAKAKVEEEPLEKVAKKPTDQVADELFGKEDIDPKDPEGKADPKKKPNPTASTTSKVIPADQIELKAIYETFVAENVWGEVEIPDDFEWTMENFKKIQALQIQAKNDDYLDKTGPYGKAIIQYEKDGGNPAELINLFQEQKTVKEFDVASPEGQEEFLTSYYEAQGYSVKSIDRTIKALIDQGGEALKEEADEKKALWDAQYTEEIENTKKQQALQAKQMEDAARNFNKNISDTLTTDTELTPKERKEIGNYILNYSQKFNGHDVSQFYVDMAEIQKDPAAYVKLAKFIKGLKNGDYDKKIADRTKKEVSAKTFIKVKNGNALSQRDGGQPDLNEPGDESSFVTYLKKKP